MTKPIIYVITGVSRSGKDEFIKQVVEIVGLPNVYNMSSVDFIKEWLSNLFAGDMRGEPARKALSDIKIALEKLDNIPNRVLIHDLKTKAYKNSPKFYFVHIREQEHIDSFINLAADMYNVIIVKVRRFSAEENIPNNDGDRLALDVDEDITVFNNDSIDELYRQALSFISGHYSRLFNS